MHIVVLHKCVNHFPVTTANQAVIVGDALLTAFRGQHRAIFSDLPQEFAFIMEVFPPPQ